jgi:hypothetical protein
MSWTVLFHRAFDIEFEDLSEAVQDELLAHSRLIEQFGPTLGRPHVDTLKGSRHANVKELRFVADGGASMALPLLLTQSEKLFSSLAEIKRVVAKRVSTNN